MTNALLRLRPNCTFGMTNEDYSTLVYKDDNLQKPTFLELTAEITRYENELKSTEYQRLRKKEYDKLNQYEMQYDDLINNTTTWQDKIEEIKAMYPKPSED